VLQAGVSRGHCLQAVGVCSTSWHAKESTHAHSGISFVIHETISS
jgi:hypothetical protein